jgi:tetratricopeptide (TPR) repeat protein
MKKLFFYRTLFFSLLFIMTSIGLVYQSKGDPDRALKYFTDSQQIRDRLGLQNTSGYALLLSSMGLLYEEQGDKGMAGKHYRNSYDTYVRAKYMGPKKDKALKNAQRLGY